MKQSNGSAFGRSCMRSLLALRQPLIATVFGLAVGAVVMNRVRSSSYPNSIMGVIYQSGQFSPVASGRFILALSQGSATSSCRQAAQAAVGGSSNVGGCLSFRRNTGDISGIVIGNHVFY